MKLKSIVFAGAALLALGLASGPASARVVHRHHGVHRHLHHRLVVRHRHLRFHRRIHVVGHRVHHLHRHHR